MSRLYEYVHPQIYHMNIIYEKFFIANDYAGSYKRLGCFMQSSYIYFWYRYTFTVCHMVNICILMFHIRRHNTDTSALCTPHPYTKGTAALCNLPIFISGIDIHLRCVTWSINVSYKKTYNTHAPALCIHPYTEFYLYNSKPNPFTHYNFATDTKIYKNIN
jgi:hypothetical protein